MGRFSDGDPEYLRNEQYANSSNLRARISLHERFSTNPYGWHRWVFDRLQLPAHALVLDIGCGSGALWSENLERIPGGWEVVLADFSMGMLSEARRSLGTVHFSHVSCDARGLPFANGTFDAVVANHMLYHVPDRPGALGEMRRVAKAHGMLFATTVGLGHMRQIDELLTWNQPGPSEFDTAEKFGLENGSTQLRSHFERVGVESYEDSLEVTDAEAIVDFIRSMPVIRSLNDRDLQAIARRAELEITERGSFHVTKSSGLFTAQP